MATKVVKFGGTSMADAFAIEKSSSIVLSDKERKFVVVSAPGKRTSKDIKVTDLLYACVHDLKVKGDCSENFNKIRTRFNEICENLKLDIDMKPYLDGVEQGIYKYRTAEYCSSRGEYLSAVVMAEQLGYEFIDASEIIVFTEQGEFDAEATDRLMAARFKSVKNAVIPGFYGADKHGLIHTFSRGGSDVTGALIARGVGAKIYENWTDVDGFLVADPRIVDGPENIEVLSYKELRELSYMGANVLHPEAIFPVRDGGIPINIKNTFNPSHPGTLIVPSDKIKHDGKIITGIAGKKDYSIVHIEKSMMNNEMGFASKVLRAFEYYNISFEHMPTGIDTLSVVVADSEVAGKKTQLIDKLKKEVHPDLIEIADGFSVIATVGHGMSFKRGTASRLFGALAKEGVNIRMIDQGSSELNIIIGVSTNDYETAIKAIYKEFFRG